MWQSVGILTKASTWLDVATLPKNTDTTVNQVVRHIFSLFAQTPDYKAINNEYKKTLAIIDQIKVDLQKQLWRYDYKIVDKQTKSYYEDLSNLNYREIYALCDFVMKHNATWLRDYKRWKLLFEVLYTYITDRAYCNTSLDCAHVRDILQQQWLHDESLLLKKIIEASDNRFFRRMVTIKVDVQNKTMTFENQESGIIDIISFE